MNNNLLRESLLRKPMFTLMLLPLSIFCSQAQNFHPAHYNPEINAAENVKDMMSSRGSVTDINLVNIFPNPAINEATLVFNSSEDSLSYEVRIVNNLGMLVHVINGTTLKGENTVNFLVGDYAPGIYYAQLLTPGEVETLKFIK